MSIIPNLLEPLGVLIDRVVPDKRARKRAQVELQRLEAAGDLSDVRERLSVVLAEAQSGDAWTIRARPAFLYVMYAMILFALPIGVIAAFSQERARAIAVGIASYLNGLPEPLYALFGTGYLGYTVARQWGKIAGTDK